MPRLLKTIARFPATLGLATAALMLFGLAARPSPAEAAIVMPAPSQIEAEAGPERVLPVQYYRHDRRYDRGPRWHRPPPRYYGPPPRRYYGPPPRAYYAPPPRYYRPPPPPPGVYFRF
jgi:hypothetical protein